MRRDERETRDISRETLLRAFRETPPEFAAGVERTLARLTSEKEEKQVKRKLALAPAIVLALALLASAAVAAALYPRTLDALRDFYGEDFAGQVEENGETAEPNETFTLGDVKYTLTDAIWNAGTLYGTIVAEPAEGANSLLLAEDMEISGPVGYNPGYGETAPDGTRSYAEAAQETGARILQASAVPDGVLVDGTVASGDVGVSAKATPENAVVTTFEIGGAQRAESYPVRISLAVRELAPEDGAPVGETQRAEWDVAVTPAAREDEATENAPEDAPIPEGTLEIAAPDAYAQSGTLPVYALTPRDFTRTVDPAFFNDSAVQVREGENGYDVTFADGATLAVSREAVFYEGHDGTTAFHGYEGNASELPAADLAGMLADLARTAFADEQAGRREKEPERDSIPALTRAEAEEALNALLEKLGVKDAVTLGSYGMDAERAKALNAGRDAAIAESGGRGYTDPYDLSGVTEEDGGWLLVCGARVGGCAADESLLSVSAFVNKQGVASLILRSMYAPGEQIETPEALLSAEEAQSRAVEAAGKSWIPEMADYLAEASDAELLYAPSTAGGLKLVPAWRIKAKDAEDGSTFSVDVSAVDGAVLDAPWM